MKQASVDLENHTGSWKGRGGAFDYVELARTVVQSAIRLVCYVVRTCRVYLATVLPCLRND
jgi:hypothetical protein